MKTQKIKSLKPIFTAIQAVCLLAATAVANQCPNQGGPAVYRSRAFLSLMNDSAVYDDYNACNQQGYYRAVKTDDKVKPESIIKPNPAKETITLIHQLEVKAGTKFLITDALGRELFTAVLPEGKKEAEFNVAVLANGFYLFRIINDKETFAHGKFAISR